MAELAPRPGAIVRIRGERWVVLGCRLFDRTSILEVRGGDRTNGSVRTHFVLPFEPIDLIPASLAPRVVRPARWRHSARHVFADGLSPDSLLRTIAPQNMSVLPFQLEPALAVLRGLGSRVLIADDVGLGKTVQAGLIVSELIARTAEAHVLIVVPAGLRDQWRSELSLRLGVDAVPLDRASLVHGSGHAEPNPWRATAVVITSLDYVKRPEVLRSLEASIWDAVVFDEAHALAGHSDRAAAATALASRARHVVLVSATPHAGDDDAFERLCRIGDLPGGFPLIVFRRTRHAVGVAGSRRTVWLRVRPTAAEAEMHDTLMRYARRVWRARASSSGGRLAMTVLVRRACSSASSLARSVERRLAMLGALADALPTQPLLPLGAILDDDEPDALLAAAGLDDVEEEARTLRRILDLARAAARHESKLLAIARLFRRVREPVIVFTEYRDTLARLAEGLAPGLYGTLHGRLTPAERLDHLHQFTSGTASVLIATDAGSEGLNLHQRCRIVVNLELPWTPLRLEQRIGRVDRLGQRQRVHALHLVAAGTGEEDTVARLLIKMAGAESSTAELRRPTLNEASLAHSVIGEEPLDERPANPRVRQGRMIVPDLRTLARAEADRAFTARLLGCGVRDPAPIGRPSVTLIRRGRAQPRCFWVFRCTPEPPDGFGPWDVLLGVAHPAPRLLAQTPVHLRVAIESCAAGARAAVEAAHADVLADLGARARPFIELSRRRELAIMSDVHRHHARLAARLLQPGLFDRRVERATAAQSSRLAEALALGAARLRALQGSAAASVGSCDLVLALVLE